MTESLLIRYISVQAEEFFKVAALSKLCIKMFRGVPLGPTLGQAVYSCVENALSIAEIWHDVTTSCHCRHLIG